MGKISYKSGYKYRLHGDVDRQTFIRPEKEIRTGFIILFTAGFLIVREGYSWDGMTGAKDTKTTMRASLIHDALCQLINEKLLPKSCQILADNQLKSICLEDGVSKIRAWWVYCAVRLFDKSGLKKYEQNEILSAP